VGIGNTTEIINTSTTTANRQNYRASSFSNTVGGNSSLLTTINNTQFDTNVAANDNLVVQWANSIGTTHPADILLDTNLRLVPIWDFLPNTAEYNLRRAQLQSEFVRLSMAQNNQFYQDYVFGGQLRKIDVYESAIPIPRGSCPKSVMPLYQHINRTPKC